jgi:hypothetical protein
MKRTSLTFAILFIAIPWLATPSLAQTPQRGFRFDGESHGSFQTASVEAQKPDASTQKITVPIPSSPAKDALFTAMHKKDQADKAVSDLNAKVLQLQQQIQQQSTQLEAQQKAASKSVDDAQVALLKEMKLDPEKYSVNLETMEATAKATPPSTTAPAPAPPGRQ